MTGRGVVTRFLLGTDGKLRPHWRALLYFALAYWVLPLALDPIFGYVASFFSLSPGLSAANLTIGELENLVVALVCTGAFALYEDRRVDSYGLPTAQALGKLTWQGALVGVLMAGGVAAGMSLLGGLQIRGFATSGGALALSTAAWLFAAVCAGLAEEWWFRSYLLQTLWKSIGFWPASIIIALLFTADHYFFKTGENIWDVITLLSLSLLMCYSVLKTGTLWFAVGFHAAFDFMQLFVIGTPNGARMPEGRLFDVTFDGPAWLTGGALGTEASFLIYPLIALAWLYLWRLRSRTPAHGVQRPLSIAADTPAQGQTMNDDVSV